jgi:hypothetical protein
MGRRTRYRSRFWRSTASARRRAALDETARRRSTDRLIRIVID